MIEDMCAFVKQIEKDPKATVTGLTVRDYLALRLHVQICDECNASVERVRKRYPDEERNINGTFNVN